MDKFKVGDRVKVVAPGWDGRGNVVAIDPTWYEHPYAILVDGEREALNFALDELEHYND